MSGVCYNATKSTRSPFYVLPAPRALIVLPLALVHVLHRLVLMYLRLRGGRPPRQLVAAVQLPLHQPAEGAVLLVAELTVRARLRDAAVGAKADDHVAALDRRQPVGDADGRVVARQQRAERLVAQRLGLGVQRRRGLVQDQDVRVLEQVARNCDTLLLAARELRAAAADLGL